MRSPLLTRRRVTAGLVAGTLLLAACGGGDGSGPDDALPLIDESVDESVDESSEVDASQSDSSEAAPAVQAAGLVDLVGAEVTAESDIDANLLPSVVVDDLNNDRKVNFRNLVPQEKPILLWMWAPH